MHIANQKHWHALYKERGEEEIIEAGMPIKLGGPVIPDKYAKTLKEILRK